MKFPKQLWTEFNGVQIDDYFSFYIMRFPIVIVRRYRFNHIDGSRLWLVGMLGVYIKFSRKD